MKWLKNLTYCFWVGCFIFCSISNDTGYPAFSQASARYSLRPAINHQTKEYTYTASFAGLCVPCLKKGWQWSDSPLCHHKICPKGFEGAISKFCFSKQGPPKRRVIKNERYMPEDYVKSWHDCLPENRRITHDGVCPEGYVEPWGHCLSEDRRIEDKRIKERVLEKGRRVCPKGSEEFKKGSKEFKNMNMFCLSISSEGKIKEKKEYVP